MVEGEARVGISHLAQLFGRQMGTRAAYLWRPAEHKKGLPVAVLPLEWPPPTDHFKTHSSSSPEQRDEWPRIASIGLPGRDSPIEAPRLINDGQPQCHPNFCLEVRATRK
jgi:hypothetical protein